MIIPFLLVTAHFLSPQAFAKGIYDGEIAAMQRQFGAYISQSEKNIAALSKLSTAYDRVAEVMEGVATQRRRLPGLCRRTSKEELLDCLGRGFSAISLIDLYVRQGLAIMPQATADAGKAGEILGQDVTEHVTKFQRIASSFRTWHDVTLPALRSQFERDRAALTDLYGASFAGDYRRATAREEAENEAQLLALELVETARRLHARGSKLLAQHRLPHARVTMQSLAWLEDRVASIWDALDSDVRALPRSAALKEQALGTLRSERRALGAELDRLDSEKERAAAVAGLRDRAGDSAVTPRDRQALEALFASLDRLRPTPQDDAIRDVLIERGYLWLEAGAR